MLIRQETWYKNFKSEFKKSKELEKITFNFIGKTLCKDYLYLLVFVFIFIINTKIRTY